MPYYFKDTTFSSFVWLNKGAAFSNVNVVEIEMNNAGAYALEVVGMAGAVISSGSRDNPHGGWSTFDFGAGMNPPVVSGMSPYKLRLVNRAPGTRNVKQGQVTP